MGLRHLTIALAVRSMPMVEAFAYPLPPSLALNIASQSTVGESSPSIASISFPRSSVALCAVVGRRGIRRSNNPRLFGVRGTDGRAHGRSVATAVTAGAAGRFRLRASSADDDGGDDDDDGSRCEASANESGGEEANASAETEEATGDGSIPKAPPPFLALGYDAAAVLNFVVAAVILILPDRTSSESMQRMGTKVAGALGYGLLAGGTCSTLSESVRAGRLKTSNTHKRLTAGTLLFGLLGLFSVPGEAGFHPRGIESTPAIRTLVLMTLAKFATAWASFAGWEYGAGGFGPTSDVRARLRAIAREIVGGVKQTWRNLPVTEERPATFYRTFFIIIMVCNLAFNLPELVFSLQHDLGFFSFPVSLTVSSIARLTLLSVITYVLKDSKEKGRLTGTTFIKLNTFVGLWALGVGLAQGSGIGGDFSLRKASDKFLFGFFFLFNGSVSQLRKIGWIPEDDGSSDPPLRI